MRSDSKQMVGETEEEMIRMHHARFGYWLDERDRLPDWAVWCIGIVYVGVTVMVGVFAG